MPRICIIGKSSRLAFPTREREAGRQTDRDTDAQRQRQTDRQKDRDRDRETETDRDREQCFLFCLFWLSLSSHFLLRKKSTFQRRQNRTVSAATVYQAVCIVDVINKGGTFNESIRHVTGQPFLLFTFKERSIIAWHPGGVALTVVFWRLWNVDFVLNNNYGRINRVKKTNKNKTKQKLFSLSLCLCRNKNRTKTKYYFWMSKYW